MARNSYSIGILLIGLAALLLLGKLGFSMFFFVLLAASLTHSWAAFPRILF